MHDSAVDECVCDIDSALVAMWCCTRCARRTRVLYKHFFFCALIVSACVSLRNSETPLLQACWKDCIAAAQVLLARGASLATTSIDGESALHYAARVGSVCVYVSVVFLCVCVCRLERCSMALTNIVFLLFVFVFCFRLQRCCFS